MHPADEYRTCVVLLRSALLVEAVYIFSHLVDSMSLHLWRQMLSPGPRERLARVRGFLSTPYHRHMLFNSWDKSCMLPAVRAWRNEGVMEATMLCSGDCICQEPREVFAQRAHSS